MSYTIRFEDRKQYLYAFIEGQDSLEASLNYWQEIAQKALNDGFDKVLVEEDLEGQVSDIDMFRLTSRFLDMGMANLQIGFVDRKDDHVVGNKLGELIVTNRGIKAKIFDAVEDAEAWLLGR